MTRRYWTAEEIDLLRTHYGPLAANPWPAARLAEELHRTRAQVWGAARYHGISSQRRPRVIARLSGKLLRLYSQGLMDREIAFRLDCSPRTVWLYRKVNGLPPVSQKGRPYRGKHVKGKSPILFGGMGLR